MTPSPLQLNPADHEYLRRLDQAFRPSVDQSTYMGTVQTAQWYQRQNDALCRALRRKHKAFIRATVIAGVMTIAAASFLLAWWFR